ncbi:hypothetical protein LCGC14_0818580 [marine sediment metagenome]|uniref:Uncharacterized protein n=1 Tax=marine sediment metagenome TaxID=412755 RepID=A0A0F9SS19_9ZZZZ
MKKEISKVSLKMILVVLFFFTLIVEVMIKHSFLISLCWSILVIFGAVVLVMEIKDWNNKRN